MVRELIFGLKRNDKIYITNLTKHTLIPLHPSMAEHHYPPRWKYDYLRMLEFLAKERVPECEAISPALTLLESKMQRGKLTKGSMIPGKVHFPLEAGTYGRFNTLRAFIVWKFYRPALFQHYLTCDYSIKKSSN